MHISAVQGTNRINILATAVTGRTDQAVYLISASSCLDQVMEGQIHDTDSDRGMHQNLDKELRSFHELHTAIGSNFNLLPLEDYFASLDDYLKYLRDDIHIDSYKSSRKGCGLRGEISSRLSERHAEIPMHA